MKKLKKHPHDFFKNTSMHKRPYHSFVWSLEERGTKFGKFLQQKNLEIFWWEFQGKFLQPRLSKRPNGCSWIVENSNTTIDKKTVHSTSICPPMNKYVFLLILFLGSFESSESVWNLVMFIWHLWTQDLSFSYLFSKSGFRYSATQR